MKIALCVSGIAGENAKKNVERLQQQFPTADLYTATWRGYEDNYPVDFVFDEPEIRYHCVLDVIPYPDVESERRINASGKNAYFAPDHGKHWNKITPHWTKQILIHNYLLTKLPDYDIIIRSRFDAVISDKIDWEHWVNTSFEDECAIGFNTRVWGYHTKVHELRDRYPKEQFNLHDALIIHPRSIWDCEHIEQLHNDKKLQAAEAGWYQVLSEHPYNYFHYMYHGGVFIEKYKGHIIDYDE